MRLKIFHSGKGDCLLLTGSNGGTVLCDGGMSSNMRRNVRSHLADLHTQGEAIDTVYISHIDSDHISGILALLEDLLDWKIYEFHRQRDNHTTVRQPDSPRPPEIKGIWHNAFRDLITNNRGRIEDLLAASVPILYGSNLEGASHIAHEMQNISASIPEALKVSRLVKPDLLDIPLNQLPGRTGPGKLLLTRRDDVPFPIGSLSFQLVGPSRKQLNRLRDGWDNWLRVNENRATTRRIRREMWRRVNEFSSGGMNESPFDLSNWNGVPNYKDVTAPNTASLMFLVEENGKTLLLTGDSQQDIILEALRTTGQLNGAPGPDKRNDYLHVDVLKVPHHGSEHNADKFFCRQVSADHYLFCGDGSHGNPDPSVLQLYYDSRMGGDQVRALDPRAQNRPFTFWFSTTASQLRSGSRSREKFQEAENLANDLAAGSGGRMNVQFNTGDFLTLIV